MVQSSSITYKLIAIAGTFDHLHEGHKQFILRAFEIGSKVILGLTSDSYVKEKLKGQSSKIKVNVKNFKERKSELENFLREKRLLLRAEIVEIHDVYGPTAREQSDIDALLVTRDSKEGGVEVNRKRKEMGLSPLELIEVPLVQAEDNRPIASARIRLGEIDRFGHLYRNLCIFENGIPEKLRTTLNKPQGRLIRNQIEGKVKDTIQIRDTFFVITVGDEVTKFLNQIGITAQVSIYDFRVHRVQIYTSVQELGFPAVEIYTHEKIKNPPGTISKNLVETIEKSLKRYMTDGQKILIEIDGEEDLAGVPAILLAPLGSVVLYGQPGEGIVIVEVTEGGKKNLLNILKTR